MNPTTIQCPHCGFALAIGERAPATVNCPHCGTAIAIRRSEGKVHPATFNEAQRDMRTSRATAIVLALTVVFGVIGAIALNDSTGIRSLLVPFFVVCAIGAFALSNLRPPPVKKSTATSETIVAPWDPQPSSTEHSTASDWIALEYQTPLAYSRRGRPNRSGAKFFTAFFIGIAVSAIVWIGGWHWMTRPAVTANNPFVILGALPVTKLIVAVIIFQFEDMHAAAAGLLVSIPIGALIFFGTCAANWTGV